MDNVIYTLPNNEEIRFADIYIIDKIKDKGEYSDSIYLNKWSFQIRLNNGEIFDVEELYYYSD